MLLTQLTKEQADKVLAEIGYSRQQLDADIEHIKEWLAEQNHLPPSRLKESKTFFEMYLTGCKGSLQMVKKKLDAYYTNRSESKALYGDRDPLQADYYNAKDSSYMALLPTPTEEGIRITLASLASSDPEKFDHANCTKRLLNLLEIRMRTEGICGGDYIIWDANNFSAGHVLKLIPSLVKDILCVSQEIAPIRIKKMLFINTISVLDVAINNIAKPFMTKKIKERVHVTSGGYEELYKFINKSVLPKDYGGDYPKTLQEISDDWSKKESTLREWFRNELSELTDESKRSANNEFLPNNSYFGIQGSIKKLIID